MDFMAAPPAATRPPRSPITSNFSLNIARLKLACPIACACDGRREAGRRRIGPRGPGSCIGPSRALRLGWRRNGSWLNRNEVRSTASGRNSHAVVDKTRILKYILLFKQTQGRRKSPEEWRACRRKRSLAYNLRRKRLSAENFFI